MEQIEFEDFKKLDIRIGRVISAEKVPDSDKLIKLLLDIGDHQRQVVAGIAGVVVDANDLVGREMPVLINLKPRTLRGEESNGMILAVNFGEVPVLFSPDKEVPPGSPVT
ncbi:MAG: methionine--tRNA ligase subunit beta [Candidatus Colwellbacteria bacterium]|nr:methionine--tRNA ligase subunit beta [Candidatus Colwellbacteria bacterium]